MEDILPFNKFFRLSIHAFVAKIQPNKVVRWCADSDFCVIFQHGCQTVFVKPVWQTQFDNRVERTATVRSTGCQTGLTTGWMFVHTIQAVVKPVWQRVWQPVVSCIQTFTRLSNPLTTGLTTGCIV